MNRYGIVPLQLAVTAKAVHRIIAALKVSRIKFFSEIPHMRPPRLYNIPSFFHPTDCKNKGLCRTIAVSGGKA